MRTKFSPISIRIKGGESIEIKEAEADDAHKWLSLIRTYLIDSDSIPLLPEEFDFDEVKATAHLEKFLLHRKNLCLLAEYNGSVIGNIDLTCSPRERLGHTSMIGMGIAEEWRHKGVGSALLSGVLDWARNHQDIEMIWLNVYSSNLAGLSLYQKFGFLECGLTPRLFKHGEEYHDNIKMYLKV